MDQVPPDRLERDTMPPAHVRPFDKGDARAAMVNGSFNSFLNWEKFADWHGQ